MKLRQFAAASLGLVITTIGALTLTPASQAQTINGLTGAWGKTCKNKVVEQFDVPMSDAVVTLGASMKQSIDDGSMTLADVKKLGLSFNWEIRGKRISGYCNVNGKGKITEFKQGLN